jgi:hypothetical protein
VHGIFFKTLKIKQIIFMIVVNHIKSFYVNKPIGFGTNMLSLPFENFYFNKYNYMRKILAARNIEFSKPTFECSCSLKLENFGLKHSEALKIRVPASSKLFVYYMFFK